MTRQALKGVQGNLISHVCPFYDLCNILNIQVLNVVQANLVTYATFLTAIIMITQALEGVQGNLDGLAGSCAKIQNVLDSTKLSAAPLMGETQVCVCHWFWVSVRACVFRACVHACCMRRFVYVHKRVCRTSNGAMHKRRDKKYAQAVG